MSHILHTKKESQEEVTQQGLITLDLYRYNPALNDEPEMERYCLPYTRRMSVFTALREIYEKQDRTLAFRNQQCGRGICGTCRVRVDLERLDFNKRLVNSCKIPLEPGDHVVVRPAYENRVIRDLVVNF